MRPSEALRLHKDAILEVLARYPVSNPRVFGSVARGEDHEGSDIDLVIDKDGRFSYYDMAQLESELTKVTGFKIDLGIFRNLKADVTPSVIKDLKRL